SPAMPAVRRRSREAEAEGRRRRAQRSAGDGAVLLGEDDDAARHRGMCGRSWGMGGGSRWNLARPVGRLLLMVERIPRGVPIHSWLDRLIHEAEERGEFEDLPGFGKPLPGLDKPVDE